MGGIVAHVGENATVDNIQPGTSMVWTVQDNAEGTLAPADLASVMATGSTPEPNPETFCQGVAFALFPQDNDNITVYRR